MDTLLAVVPPKYLAYVAAACGAAAMLDAWLPQPKAGSVWVWPRKVISLLGQNYGHAANAVKPGAAR